MVKPPIDGPFNEMAPTCWGLLNAVEIGGFEQLQNHLQFQSVRSDFLSCFFL